MAFTTLLSNRAVSTAAGFVAGASFGAIHNRNGSREDIRAGMLGYGAAGAAFGLAGPSIPGAASWVWKHSKNYFGK